MVFTLWQMQTKEHVMVYLRPSAVCYIHNSLQRPDWGRAFPVSHQEVYRTFLWILLCFFHSDANLLQKETTKLSLLLILLLFSICTAQRKQDKYLGSPTGRLTWYGAIQELSRMPGSSSHRFPTALQRTQAPLVVAASAQAEGWAWLHNVHRLKKPNPSSQRSAFLTLLLVTVWLVAPSEKRTSTACTQTL